MATVRWRGGAKPTFQIQTYAFAGTWETDDLVRIQIGRKRMADITGGSATVATVIDTIVTAFNLLSTTIYPEFATITASRSSNSLVLTADDPGDGTSVPFTCTVTPLEANGGAADAQTIEGAGAATTGTTATAPAGPNFWSTAQNWDGDAVPVAADDVVVENTDDNILYGLDANTIALTTLTIPASSTGTIGLPEQNESGYPEYRELSLKIRPGILTIGAGPGGGSSRVKINKGTVAAATMRIYGSGSPAESGVPAILLQGAHASDVLDLLKGSVGLAFSAGEAANLSGGFRVGHLGNPSGDVSLVCGSGLTVAAVTISGGTIEFNSNITTLTMTDGDVTLRGTATLGTAVIDGGTLRYNTSGTLGTALSIGGGGKVDFTQDMRAKTVTPVIQLFEGAALDDGFGVVVYTAGFKLNRCLLSDTKINIGNNRTCTVA